MPTNNRLPDGRYDRRLVDLDDKMRRLDIWRMNLVPPDVGIFDEPKRCYELNNQWAKIVMGLVSWLADTPIWRDAEDEGYFAITEILEFMIGKPCMSFQLRQNPDNACLLEQSLDGGDTWTTAFDYSLCQIQSSSSDALNASIDALDALLEQYDGTVESVAPDMVYDATETDEIRDMALCHAVNELVNLLCEAELEHRANWEFIAIGFGIAATVVGFLVTIGTLGTGTPAYMALCLALTAGGTSILSEFSDELLQDTGSRDDVVCCMVTALKGETITKTNFENSLDACGFAGGSNASQLAGAISNWLTDDDVYETFLDAMQRSYRYAELGIADCPCDLSTDWTWDSDFPASQNIWAVATSGFGNRALWTGGSGYSSRDVQISSSPNRYMRMCQIQTADFTPTRIDTITLTYNLTKGSAWVDPSTTCILINTVKNDNSTVDMFVSFASATNGSNQTLVLDVNEDDIKRIVVSARSSLNSSASYSGSCKVVAVQVTGSDFNPFE